MMKRIECIKIITGMLISVFVFSQCKHNGNNSFNVAITYKNLDKLPPGFFENDTKVNKPVNASLAVNIMLQEIPYGGDMNPVIIDSTTLHSPNGKVILKGRAKEESIFQLALENRPVLLLVNDVDELEVDMDLSKTEDFYTIKNSPATQKLKDFIYAYSEKSYEINKAFAYIDSLKQFGANDSLLIVATEKKNKAVSNINSFQQQFITNSSNPALSVFALGLASRSFPKDQFEGSLKEVVKRFPEHQTLKKLKETYESQKANANRQEQQKKPETNSWKGKPAPDLALPTPEGDTLAISSFRGKYLLVDFWASWCGPCREENPNVVKAFNQFKDKNFTILGVSLDQKKSNWQQAIVEDHLAWKHVSDLKFWDSKAVEVYKFEGIPFNVLVDPNGIIVAENLRGFDLIKKLQEVLK